MISKNLIRKQALEIRKSFSPSFVESVNLSVSRNCIDFILSQSFEEYLLYCSRGIEISTDSLTGFLLSNSKKVYFPKCFIDGVMNFYRVGNTVELIPGMFGILEPDGNSELFETNSSALLIVPALTVTPKGFRIGWGGGYFDRFLANHNVVSAALCCDENIIDSFEIESTDYPVDFIITQSGVYSTNARKEVMRNE